MTADFKRSLESIFDALDEGIARFKKLHDEDKLFPKEDGPVTEAALAKLSEEERAALARFAKAHRVLGLKCGLVIAKHCVFAAALVTSGEYQRIFRSLVDKDEAAARAAASSVFGSPQ